MVEHVNDRVKKHRASKKQTAQGLEEIRAANRKYAERARRKRMIKKLTEEKDDMKLLLNPIEKRDMESAAMAARDRLRAQLSKDKLLSEDKQRYVIIKVLKYEVKKMKAMTKGRTKKEKTSRHHHPDEPPKGRIDETSNPMIQMPVSTQIPVPTRNPPKGRIDETPNLIPQMPVLSKMPDIETILQMPLIPDTPLITLITQMPNIDPVSFGALNGDDLLVSLSGFFQSNPLFA